MADKTTTDKLLTSPQQADLAFTHHINLDERDTLLADNARLREALWACKNWLEIYAPIEGGRKSDLALEARDLARAALAETEGVQS